MSLNPVSEPIANPDLEATWKGLEEGVNQVMTKFEEGITHAKYMQLYTRYYSINLVSTIIVLHLLKYVIYSILFNLTLIILNLSTRFFIL